MTIKYIFRVSEGINPMTFKMILYQKSYFQIFGIKFHEQSTGIWKNDLYELLFSEFSWAIFPENKSTDVIFY